jgi:hypothetical protein
MAYIPARSVIMENPLFLISAVCSPSTPDTDFESL